MGIGEYTGIIWGMWVGCKVQAGIPMLAFHVGEWVCAGHSVSEGICGHKDGMEAGDWDAVIESRTVDVWGEISRHREGCGLMQLRE